MHPISRVEKVHERADLKVREGMSQIKSDDDGDSGGEGDVGALQVHV